MKKIILSLLMASLILTSFTGCLKKKNDNSETPDSADTSQSASEPTEKCKFDPEEVKDDITDFARDHGLKNENILCYKSDNYFKIDITRITSDYDLQRQYEDAIRDIIANGNDLNAKKMYFNVETVLLDDYGYFLIYISYDYEYDSDK